MLLWILRALFSILFWVLNAAGTVLFVYTLLLFLLPSHNITRTIGRFIEPLLEPIRRFIRRRIPALANLPLDFSPLGLWLLLKAASWVVRLLAVILVGR